MKRILYEFNDKGGLESFPYKCSESLRVLFVSWSEIYFLSEIASLSSRLLQRYWTCTITENTRLRMIQPSIHCSHKQHPDLSNLSGWTNHVYTYHMGFMSDNFPNIFFRFYQNLNTNMRKTEVCQIGYV